MGKVIPDLKAERSRREKIQNQEQDQQDSTFLSPDNFDPPNRKNSTDIQTLQQQLKNLQEQINKINKLTNNSPASS